jgi:integrase
VNFIRAVYNWDTMLDVYDGANPAIGRFRFTCPPRERFLTTEEARRFLEGIETLPPKPRAYLWTMLLTGARGIEIRSMRWNDIDWSTRLWTKAKTKNGKPQYLPLPPQVVTAIKELPRTSEWFFSDVRGPWSADSAEKVWLLCRRRWNLGDVTLHDIRRTCASYLAISGENLPTIQNVLGHRSLSPTSIYAHLNTKAVDRALQAQADWFCSMLQPWGLIEQATSLTGRGSPPTSLL